MCLNGKAPAQDRLILRSQLSEIARVPGWIEGLASRYTIPVNIQLSISLCLEEALANVILHGYRSELDRAMLVHVTIPRDGFLVFAIEDDAPRFNPLASPELAALNPSDGMRVGGQGIRFLRQFADSLEYEPTPAGNRLRIGFSTTNSAAAEE